LEIHCEEEKTVSFSDNRFYSDNDRMQLLVCILPAQRFEA